MRTPITKRRVVGISIIIAFILVTVIWFVLAMLPVLAPNLPVIGAKPRLEAEIPKLTLPGTQLASQSFDSGSTCLDACPDLNLVYKLPSNTMSSMEAAFDSRMKQARYSHGSWQSAPYTWDRGSYEVGYRWVNPRYGDDPSKLVVPSDDVNELIVDVEYKF